MDDNIAIKTDKGAAADKGKLIKLAVITVILAAILGSYLWWNNLQNYISTDNAKVAGDIIDISSKVSGRLEILSVHEGDSVQAGQVIAELDSTQFKINLDQARAALELAQANYDKLPDDLKSTSANVEKAQQNVIVAQAQLKAADLTAADSQRNLTQSEQLYKSGAISKEALDVATSAHTKSQAAAEAALAAVLANQAALADSQAKEDSLAKTGDTIYLAGLKQAQAAYATAQLNLANVVIKAPQGGTVVRLAVQAGENLSAGQTILSISDLNTTWISANIEEDKFGRLQLGQDVEVKLDAFPGSTFSGKISELGEATQSTFALIPTENTAGNYTKVKQRFSCKIAIVDKGVVLKPGMSAIIKIHTGR